MFRELFISIVKLELTSVKQVFTNGTSVKKIQQSIDLIGLDQIADWKNLPIKIPTTQLNENILNLQF